MEKGLVNPNWLVTTRITPSFPWKYFQSYNEITNAASTAKQTIPFLSAPNQCQPQAHNPQNMAGKKVTTSYGVPLMIFIH